MRGLTRECLQNRGLELDRHHMPEISTGRHLHTTQPAPSGLFYTHPPEPTMPKTAASTPTTPPLPGQYWPEQQGHYAGIMRSDDGSTGWHVIKPDAPELVLPKMAWGEYGLDIPGAQSRFDGHANTLAMAAAGSPLAATLRALPGDCYLPSQAEAALCAATMPQVFKPGWHWTSTQYSRHSAWFQGFEYGDSDTLFKDLEFRAVAVRRIQL